MNFTMTVEYHKPKETKGKYCSYAVFERSTINIYPYITVIVRVYAATFSPNFMSKSRGASYMCISSFKPFYPHKISRGDYCMRSMSCD